MGVLMTFAERIKGLRKHMGLTQTAFAERIGVSMPAVQAWEYGKSKAGGDVAKTIAETFNISFSWLLSGEGSMVSLPLLSEVRETTPEKMDAQGFYLIPRYSVSAAAGIGAQVVQEYIADYLSFQKKWLNSLPYPKNTLHMITVSGDSMEPTYKDRDLILLTTDYGSFQPGVYVIKDYSGVRLKRLNVDRDMRLIVISDNTIYPEEAYTKQECDSGLIRIIGKVIWVGRTV